MKDFFLLIWHVKSLEVPTSSSHQGNNWTEKSLRSTKEVGSQAKWLSPKLERQAGKYKEFQVTRAEIQEQQLLWEPLPG